MPMFPMLATCARGFEAFLEGELSALGVQNAQASSGGVTFQAPLELAMKLCLWSRIANKIEIRLGECYAQNEDSIYELGRKIPLDPWLSPCMTFCVRAHVNDARFKNSVFLSLKLKDGLVDHMREAWGQRASIDTERPDVVIGLQVIAKKARVFLELQGDPLNMRGYRRRQVQAPIRETLAASMIAMSGWQQAMTPFVDPMCGSGTFAIEAALAASNTAPGIQRHFGFEKLANFSDFSDKWRTLREEARDLSKKSRRTMPEIQAMDIDPSALDLAQNNAQTAGVSDFIRFSQGDVLRMAPSDHKTILTNPPYGERICVNGLELPEFYYQLGRLVRNFDHSTLTIISTADLLKKNMHLKPSQRISTYNGPIACETATYALGGMPKKQHHQD